MEKLLVPNLVKQLWQLSGFTSGIIGTIGVEVGERKFESSANNSRGK
jgi:hypothetical protein